MNGETKQQKYDTLVPKQNQRKKKTIETLLSDHFLNMADV